jgi:hypothetical protein
VAGRFSPTRHAIFRVISQTQIHYPHSPLSRGTAGHVHGGDRLPWLGHDESDNFAVLRSLDWQLHVYGEMKDDLAIASRERGLARHAFPWSHRAQDAGFKRDAAYLVRPDGYVASALPEQSAPVLKTYLDQFGIRFADNFSPAS